MALADQRRRAQRAMLDWCALAPMAAGGVLFVAVLARLARISTAVPLALLAGVVVILALVTWVRSRRRQTTDAIAAAVDRDAALRGELRSAHWFERRAPATTGRNSTSIARPIEPAASIGRACTRRSAPAGRGR